MRFTSTHFDPDADMDHTVHLLRDLPDKVHLYALYKNSERSTGLYEATLDSDDCRALATILLMYADLIDQEEK